MKTLTEMAIEASTISHEHGWYDTGRTFGDYMALLHSEVSEILEAYRDNGCADATRYFADDNDYPNRKVVNPKPEGVGAEMADVLIRLLDTAHENSVDLAHEVGKFQGVWGINTGFGDAVNQLHNHITRLSIANEDVWDTEWEQIGRYYAGIYVYLRDWALSIGVDLQFEYERKTAYNRTRPYRHGGKRL